MKKLKKSRKGILNPNHKHGMSKTRVYRCWANMISRCSNPNLKNYNYYGGRGISVCERWHDFINFFNDMGHPPEKMSLERVDVNGNYELENCIWADSKTQSLNKRFKPKNKYIGVYRSSMHKSERYVAYISLNGKTINVGYFKTELDAHKARENHLKDVQSLEL